jgi:hypothetical protein
VQSARLLQGVRSTVDGWRHFLCTSNLKHILDEHPTLNLERSDEVIERFEAFTASILQSPGLHETQATVCDEAIEKLVWV